MSRPEVWLAIALAALVTLLERGSFLLTQSDAPLPPLVRRCLRYVPAAVFAAITVPALAQPSGTGVGPLDVRLLAGLVAAGVAWRTRNVTLTFVVGMVMLWLVTWALRSALPEHEVARRRGHEGVDCEGIEVAGTVDSGNPNVFSGSVSDGTPQSGTITSWSLVVAPPE